MIAVAVGISTLTMSVLNLHHPPANGTALAVTLGNSGLLTAESILSSLVILLVFSTIFRKYFYNEELV